MSKSRSTRTAVRVVPATTQPSPTAIPTIGGPTLTQADIAAIAAVVVPQIAQALVGAQMSTPAPVVEVTAADLPLPTPPALATQAQDLVASPEGTKVTYRNAKGETHVCTPAQFTQRQRMASGTLTIIEVTAHQSAVAHKPAKGSKKAAQAKPAKATPAWIQQHGANKAARKALSAALRTKLGRAYTPEEWAAAKAQAGIA